MDRHLIADKAKIIDAVRALNSLSGGVMTLFVGDSRGRVTGTVTDGDVRRALLGGVSVDDPVSKAANTRFKALRGERIDLRLLRQYRKANVRLIPRLDGEGKIVEIIDTTKTPTRLPVGAILMAGGKGERLRPLTLTTPKPLLKIGDRPIIDYNIEALRRCGVERIYVTVNYMAEKIEAHFAGTGVECVREDRPLGTIGAAALVDLPEEGSTIVMNSDLLTTISFEEMFLHHEDENADITIAAVPYNVSVPYAILTTDGPLVTNLEEKPSYAYYANAGIYIFSNRLLRKLSPDRRTDATDLIEAAIASGKRVGYFPISGTWIDIGSPTDYAHAKELMRHHLDSRR
ncbi:MAG: nucleotidyltransferase family protein [Paramuribaculum sp.]|nr:nucleotidyltransferase family protein [Paramuribaculum sp.]